MAEEAVGVTGWVYGRDRPAQMTAAGAIMSRWRVVSLMITGSRPLQVRGLMLAPLRLASDGRGRDAPLPVVPADPRAEAGDASLCPSTSIGDRR